jgi:hypothetical protein
MGLEYAPSSITEIQGADVFVAFVQSGVNRLGEPTAVRWWNHTDGGFESTFSQTDHLRALARVSGDPSSPNHALQSFGVPMDMIEDNMDVQAFLYVQGDALTPYKVLSRSHLGYFSGA